MSERCEHRHGQKCELAADLVGIDCQCETTEAACKQCDNQDNPRSANSVTASLAINWVRLNDPDRVPSIVHRLRPLLAVTHVKKTNPGVMAMTAGYVESTVKWVAAGCPMRTDEEVSEIFVSLCRPCEHSEDLREEAVKCRVCGCGLNLLGAAFNKIRRRTENCPIHKW